MSLFHAPSCELLISLPEHSFHPKVLISWKETGHTCTLGRGGGAQLHVEGFKPLRTNKHSALPSTSFVALGKSHNLSSFRFLCY